MEPHLPESSFSDRIHISDVAIALRCATGGRGEFRVTCSDMLPYGESMSVIGVVVGSTKIILVEGDLEDDGTATILRDEVLDLEKGERHEAYAVMHRRIVDRFADEAIERVVMMASSAGKFTGTQSALHAAELRGVFLSAIPQRVKVIQSHKKTISRDFGSRKVAEYVKDDEWWDQNFTGECRKGSREAAFLIISKSE